MRNDSTKPFEAKQGIFGTFETCAFIIYELKRLVVVHLSKLMFSIPKGVALQMRIIQFCVLTIKLYLNCVGFKRINRFNEVLR